MARLPQIVEAQDPATIDRAVAAAAAVLARGDLVGMPTETVYGLAGDATNPDAIAAIFATKARPRFNPLIVHVASVEAAMTLAAFSPEASTLAEAFWPGALTLVLPKRTPSPIADLATAGLDTLAIRVPHNPVAQALLAEFGRPIAAPSANRSGKISPTTASHVADDLDGEVALILDAGDTPVGIESTIVGLSDGTPRLLRSGGIARSQIEDVLGRPLVDPIDSDAPSAPGMLRSHYAPNAHLRLDVDAVRPSEALLAFGQALPPGAESAVAMINLSPAGDVREAATRLFAAMRDLDAKADAIAVVPIPETGLGEAINDRLRRAAAPRERS
ncbi:L-threonylcarbamoyladenylate synthase [Bauldia sp.]|uniref:L-threonylcarbamoyladenylate synthase n=1 Tax=Bauldia sp. TaxID=2575872 RepID=UPI003BAC4746